MRKYIPESISLFVPINTPQYAAPIELLLQPPNLNGNNQCVYPPLVVEQMRWYYDTLSEKDKRRYAAVESLKIGHGGIAYISRVLGCSEPTIRKGIKEINNLLDDDYGERIRNPGAGRKPYYEIYPDIDEKFLAVLKDRTAGEPCVKNITFIFSGPSFFRTSPFLLSAIRVTA